MNVESILIFFVGFVVISCQNVPGVPPVMHQGQGSMPHVGHDEVVHRQGVPTHGHHKFKDGAKDRDHVMEHLDGMVDQKANTEQMTEDEVQFHYFKLHDYDNNNMLDGIELVAALTHYHKDEDPNNVKPLIDDDLKNLVDTILKEDDRNSDGYIDYAEFIVSQRG